MHSESESSPFQPTEDRVCGNRTDARHIREIDPKYPIEFTPKIKDDWFMVLTSMLGPLRLRGYVAVRCGVRRQIYNVASDLAINFYDQLLIIPVRGKRLTECKQRVRHDNPPRVISNRILTASDAAIT